MVSLRNRVEQGFEDFAHFVYRNDTLKLTFREQRGEVTGPGGAMLAMTTVPSGDFRQNMTIRIPSN